MDNAEKEGSSFAAQHRESTYPCPSPRENKRLFQSPRHSCAEDAAGHGDNTLSPTRQPDAFPCSLTCLESCLGSGSPALGVFRSQSHFSRVLRPTGVLSFARRAVSWVAMWAQRPLCQYLRYLPVPFCSLYPRAMEKLPLNSVFHLENTTKKMLHPFGNCSQSKPCQDTVTPGTEKTTKAAGRALSTCTSVKGPGGTQCLSPGRDGGEAAVGLTLQNPPSPSTTLFGAPWNAPALPQQQAEHISCSQILHS